MNKVNLKTLTRRRRLVKVKFRKTYFKDNKTLIQSTELMGILQLQKNHSSSFILTFFQFSHIIETFKPETHHHHQIQQLALKVPLLRLGELDLFISKIC